MARPLKPAERAVLVVFITALALLLRAGFVAQTYIKSPLLIRIPLADPDRLLGRLLGPAMPLFGGTGFMYSTTSRRHSLLSSESMNKAKATLMGMKKLWLMHSKGKKLHTPQDSHSQNKRNLEISVMYSR